MLRKMIIASAALLLSAQVPAADVSAGLRYAARSSFDRIWSQTSLFRNGIELCYFDTGRLDGCNDGGAETAGTWSMGLVKLPRKARAATSGAFPWCTELSSLPPGTLNSTARTASPRSRFLSLMKRRNWTGRSGRAQAARRPASAELPVSEARTVQRNLARADGLQGCRAVA